MEAHQSFVTKQQLIDIAFDKVFSRLAREGHYELVSALGAALHCGKITVTYYCENYPGGADCLMFCMPNKKTALIMIKHADVLFAALHEAFSIMQLRICTIQNPLTKVDQPDNTYAFRVKIAPDLVVHKFWYKKHPTWLTYLKAA
ncbi:MAG: hypothetical protein CLLPBCKN_003382 [Chroococcidiopsis cubana SAG 39.79]|uniref:Uncharacterized protein n=1 Tax=Chroococcidiopsis cubana SAG 39.79 TaxID=388085 RepID=A0AB37UI47_9CYAN|nr:hypothetical protein [Chroococcidiopsis cubana]MDZ4873986.1 hypothetical protein [Chroococcidiopsis cubana SAG 39.79]PSB63367.1 hypothetical protein C7B79_14220 [Chroococcidiopsis cubana CCALA 043]RUT11057.1 hypothetical protein DSM107010_36910 [Chroococcidiopsis cubana SAG 39.79]